MCGERVVELGDGVGVGLGHADRLHLLAGTTSRTQEQRISRPKSVALFHVTHQRSDSLAIGGRDTDSSASRSTRRSGSGVVEHELSLLRAHESPRAQNDRAARGTVAKSPHVEERERL